MASIKELFEERAIKSIISKSISSYVKDLEIEVENKELKIEQLLIELIDTKDAKSIIKNIATLKKEIKEINEIDIPSVKELKEEISFK